MQFLANENIPAETIYRLRDSGQQVVAVIEDCPGEKDRNILIRAATESYVIITFDRDYGALIYEEQLTPPLGIVYFRFIPRSPDEPAELLLQIIENEQIQLKEKFTVVERDRIRQRPLRKDTE